MKKMSWLLVAIVMGTAVFGCNGKADNRPAPASKVGSKASSPEAANDRDLALKFLQGIQKGDKKIMYEATNLTPEMVNESREKLIHPQKYKLSNVQISENETALRISGEIDFLAAKLRKMLPKSATFDIAQTTAHDATKISRDYTHTVKIIYGEKAEALQDKSGKPVKEISVQLQHAVRLANGRPLHEIAFTSYDFDKMADKDFTVLSYF